MIRISLNIAPIISCLELFVKIIEFLDNEAKKRRRAQIARVATVVNILTMACHLCILLLDSEQEYKIHDLIQTLSDYQLVHC